MTTVELIFPRQHAQPLTSCAAVLTLAQGFNRDELFQHARTLSDGLFSVPPFNDAEAGRRMHGRVAVLADPLVEDPPVTYVAAAPEPRVLRLVEDGAVLEGVLDRLPVFPGLPLSGDTDTAAVYWGLRRTGGVTAKLVAILRKPSPGTPPAMFYGPPEMPVVAVDVTPDRPWFLVVVRALAQLMANLGDEFSRTGPEWERPAGQVAGDPHRLGRNLIVIDSPEDTALLGHRPIRDLVEVVDVWRDFHNRGPTPYTPPGHPVVGYNSRASFQLTNGGGGFRTGVVHADQPCLMAQAPATPGARPPIPGTRPLGDEMGWLCFACEQLVALTFGRLWPAQPGYEGLRRQLSQFARTRSSWHRTEYPAQHGSSIDVSATVDRGAEWHFVATVDNVTGLKITALELRNRPTDPMRDSPDVAELITFGDLSYTVGGQPRQLHVQAALANPEAPPRFVKGTSDTNDNRVGVELTLTWHTDDGLAVRAEMSLVCRTIRNDFDPGGAVEACRFYPELTMTWWPRKKNASRKVDKLSGTVTIVADNRLLPGHMHGGGHGDAHGGLPPMVEDKQTCMLLTDSNASKYDSHYIDLLGYVWRSGRLMGNLDTITGRGAWWAWHAGLPGLPEWSWLFDYGRQVPVQPPDQPPVDKVVVWEDRGAGDARSKLRIITKVQWPPNPDPNLDIVGAMTGGGGRPLMSVTKLPRQGAFDNVHLNADMGVDEHGRKVIAAPFCADLCLHLHVRWGVHAAENASPLFFGWSSGVDAAPHVELGAPLVPPNQRIRFKVHRPNAQRTHIDYVADAFAPIRGCRQVFLEQGLAFGFTYGGLGPLLRRPLVLVYGESLSPAERTTFFGPASPARDIVERKFFQGVYERIRFYSYGVTPKDPASAPQQVPTHTAAGDPFGPDSAIFGALEDL